MVENKIYKKSLAYLGIFLILASIAIFAADYDGWTTYTSINEVRKVDYFNDSLQVVTSGGWVKVDPISLGINKLTNVDGLGTGDLYDILKDSDGDIWIAGYGRLIKYSTNQFSPYLFFDRSDKPMPLLSIEDDDDMIWVGTSTGLARFSKSINGGQIDDFYFRFGDLNPEPGVLDIKIIGDSIWLATSAGLAVADKSNPDLLKSYVNWTTFGLSQYPELDGDTVSALAYYNNSIYIGTNHNTYSLNIGGSDTSFVEISTREPAFVNSMQVFGDTLAIYTRNGFYIYDGITSEWSSTGSIPSARFASGVFINGTHWLGMQSEGIYYSDGGGYTRLEDGGLPGNYVTVLESNSDGIVAGGFQRRGVALFDGESWTKGGIVGTIENGVREGVRALSFDNSDNLWVGTWGNGVMKIEADQIINYDETNSTLLGISANPNYVVSNSMINFENYLFMTNYQAYDGRSVSVVDLNNNSQWRYFDRNDSLTSEFPVSIDFYDGTFAVGTQYTGVFTYYSGFNPLVETSYKADNLREDNMNLGSNSVNVVRYDNNGVLWVGHQFGLSRFDDGIPLFFDVELPLGLGPDVISLIFDGRNNAWIGTRTGLGFYNMVTGEYEVYTSLNSGLPDNQINTLSINPVTGDLWVGTPYGVSRVRSSIGIPTDKIGQVKAFPNPFIIGDGTERLNFNYDGAATVTIYTSAGEMVRRIPINIPWDGKNQSGRDVSSGVYLALLTNESGEVGRCKIMLIRN